MLKSSFRLLFFGLLITAVFLTIWISTNSPDSLLAVPNSQTIVLGGDRIKFSSPVAADLNGNGRQEIVVGAYDGMVYVLSYIGSSWTPVWSRQTASDINTGLPVSEQQATGIVDAAPAIGDIDEDGQLEIVIATGGRPNSATPSINRNGGIIVYELDSASGSNWQFSVKSGWPFIMPDTMGQGPGGGEPDGVRDGILSTPTLGDIDGDDDLEIISMSFDRRIRAFHHDGSVVAGWPIQRENGDVILRGGESSAAIADIDNDGLNEIIIGTNSPPWNGDNNDGPFPPEYDFNPDYTLGTLWALNGDSSFVPGFPVITEQIIKSSPAIGDIDGDGDLEIVAGTGEFPGYVNGRQVYAWHTDGTPVAGWPTSTDDFMLSSPALADLDGNGVLDVIIGCGFGGAPPFCSLLYAWDGSGNSLPGFPFDTSYNLPYAPVVADIDGDDNLEIILTSLETVSVIVVQHDGSNSPSPIDTSRSTGGIILSSPLVGDLDGDGDLETVIGGANGGGQATVYVFDEVGSTSPDPENIPWPMFQRNSEHTGLWLPPTLNLMNELYIFHQEGSGNTATLKTAVHNIGGEEFDWEIDESGTGGAVQAAPDSGTLQPNNSETVTFTVDTTPYVADQWHDLGTINLSGMANGQNIANSPQTVTVNLYVGDIFHIYLPIITR